MLPHRQAGKCASVLLGTAVIALTLSQIHAPAGLAEGGTFGFSLLLYHQFGLSPAVSSFFLDMLLLLCAARVFGKAFVFRSLLAVASYAAFYALFDKLPPLLLGLTGSPFAAAVAGGLLLGVGTALVVGTGTACGGDDAAAMVLSHWLNLPLASHICYRMVSYCCCVHFYFRHRSPLAPSSAVWYLPEQFGCFRVLCKPAFPGQQVR